jgi:restriction endonuclease Mrr
MKVLSRCPEYAEFRARTKQRKGQQPPNTVPVTREDLSPREAIEDVIDSTHSAVASDLLARVLEQPPVFLEQLVLRLLVKMGYGGLETPAEHLGAPGDAGLDGLIRLDKLGLDVVYVQAKRYTDRHVSRPDIQAFVGALHGAQASRGIFITTSRFSLTPMTTPSGPGGRSASGGLCAIMSYAVCGELAACRPCHLYAKLGAHSRVEAVDSARALGLLAPSGLRR